MPMSVDLLLCPFCGKAPLKNRRFAWCGGSGDIPHGQIILALDVWNTRTASVSGEKS